MLMALFVAAQVMGVVPRSVTTLRKSMKTRLSQRVRQATRIPVIAGLIGTTPTAICMMTAVPSIASQGLFRTWLPLLLVI